MRVLSFDPGYERLGVSVIEEIAGAQTLLYSDCVRTDSGEVFSKRLYTLAAEVEHLLEVYTPTHVALETLFFQKNQKTAMHVAEVRGVLLYLAEKSGVIISEYSPQEIKIAITGNGRANKEAILRMIPHLIALPKKKMLDDELDAIGVGLTALAHIPKSR